MYRIPEELDRLKPHHFKKGKTSALTQIVNNDKKEPTPIFLTEHTFMFILSGSKIIFSNGKKMIVGENNLVLLERGYYVMCERLDTDPVYESLVLYFNELILKDIWNKYNDLLRAGSGSMLEPVLELNQSEPIEKFKSELISLLQSNTQFLDHFIKNRFEELVLTLIEENKSPELISFVNRILKHPEPGIEKVVSSNLFTPLTVEDMAKLAGMSLSSFKREFQKIYNSSPRKWISARRLEHARSLVRTTSKTVNEISFDCGFEDPSYFIKLYKRNFGITPKAELSQYSD